MKTYRVTKEKIQGRNNIMFNKGDMVKESDFIPGTAERLRIAGYLELHIPIPKIGVLIPDRGDRPDFLAQALNYISRQTLQPHLMLLKNEAPISDAIDITYRYRTGCEELFAKGCEVVFFWENDDWYAPNYIEKMVQAWQKAGKPPIFGIGNTIYYHLQTGQYVKLNHPRRSSAMNIMVTNAVLKAHWGDDSYAYTDWQLWCQYRSTGKTALFNPLISLGIKHGVGLCGGGGHTENFAHYNQTDDNDKLLREIVGNDYEFYIQMRNKLTTKKQ